MRNRYLFVVIISIILAVIFAQCGTKTEEMPLPSAAIRLGNYIEIPFPYEAWRLDRDIPNQDYVLKVLNKDEVVAAFPLSYSNTPERWDTITLGGKEYAVVSINLYAGTEQGIVTLKPVM